MGDKLPGWVVDNRTSVRREAAPYRDMTPEQRLAVLDVLCQDAAELLAGREASERLRQYRDPLPESTKAALIRLRKDARHG